MILILLASKNYDNFLNRIQRQIQKNIEKYWSSNNLTKKQPRIWQGKDENYDTFFYFIFPSILLSSAFNICSCLKTRSHISQQHAATGITVLHQASSSTGNRQLHFHKGNQILQTTVCCLHTSLLLSITLGIILGKLWPNMCTKRSSEIPSVSIFSKRWQSCCPDVFTKQRVKTSCWKAAGSGLKWNSYET